MTTPDELLAALNRHRYHIVDQRYATQVVAGRYTMSVFEPKKPADCKFCQDPTLMDRMLDLAGAP